MGSKKNVTGSVGAAAPAVIGWGWPCAPFEGASEKLWERYYLSCERIAIALAPKTSDGSPRAAAKKTQSSAPAGASERKEKQAPSGKKAASSTPKPPAAKTKPPLEEEQAARKLSGAARRKARKAREALATYEKEEAVSRPGSPTGVQSPPSEQLSPLCDEEGTPTPARRHKMGREDALHVYKKSLNVGPGAGRYVATERVRLLASRQHRGLTHTIAPKGADGLAKGECNGRWTHTRTGEWTACGICCECSVDSVCSDSTGTSLGSAMAPNEDLFAAELHSKLATYASVAGSPAPSKGKNVSFAPEEKGDATRQYRPRRA